MPIVHDPAKDKPLSDVELATVIDLATRIYGIVPSGLSFAGKAITLQQVLDLFRAQSALLLESLIVAVSDEATDLTAGTAKLTFRMPYAFTLTAVRASLSAASTSGAVQVDVNEAGVSVFGANKLTIDQGEKTSVTAATPATLTDTALADDAEITIDIDAAGTGAKGLKVTLIGYRS